MGWLAVALSVLRGLADDARVDFRNYIPGVLDAPVYRADGTNRLSAGTGTVCFAILYAGPDEGSMRQVGDLERFGAGEWAGYLGQETVNPRVLPFAQPGDRVSVHVQAWEVQGFWTEVMTPRFIGTSEVFNLVVSNTPTPLIGLKSFRLQPASIAASVAEGRVVLWWSAGDGTVNYDLEETSVLGPLASWERSALKPVLDGSIWVVTNELARPADFYRIKLLNP